MPIRPDALIRGQVSSLPVYREPSVIPDLAAAMRALDYPSLEIVMLVEEDDNETRAALDFWPFQVLVVPDGRPRTKPRAVNYGLLHTHGEIVVVFDAEDRPAPDQPKRAVARMIESGAAVVQTPITLRRTADENACPAIRA